MSAYASDDANTVTERWQAATGCDTPEDVAYLRSNIESEAARELVRWRAATGCRSPDEAKRKYSASKVHMEWQRGVIKGEEGER